MKSHENKNKIEPKSVVADVASENELYKPNDLEGVSETDVTAEIIVPEEGGWGWIVVAGSFMCIFILDGIFFTFGSIYKDISEDLDAEVSFVALINSITIALYFLSGPVVSAFINRFGFRCCTMAGSIIASCAFFLSHFAQSYIVLLLLYGILPGFGGCLILMSSQLIVGFYFERLRALAMAIAGLGQSFGISIMFSVNSYLVQLAGWRTATLIHAGLLGTIYFIGMIYRPLLSLSITQTTEDVQTVTYLPSMSTIAIKKSRSRIMDSPLVPTASERLFRAVSNTHFPTAAEVIEEQDDDQWDINTSEPGPSSASVQKLTLKARHPEGGISQRQLKQVHSIMSRTSLKDKEKKIEIKVINVQPHKKHTWWSKCCQWEKHVKESRPMYRDDAFYNGRLQNLPVYQKSMVDARRGTTTGLEYQMAVSRAVANADLKEHKGVFTTAVRRILATMMNPQLLKRNSFLMVCITGFLIHLGILVPYVFISDRNRSEGIDDKDCKLFVSVIGFSNAVGRLIAGLLGCKLNPVKIYSVGCILAGTGTIASNFSYNVYYQYCCCVVFGVSLAQISTLRSLVLVDLYGLDNLTNATGILLMFQGFGALFSTPLCSVLKNRFGYACSFYVAGTFMVSGGLVIANVRKVVRKENRVKTRKNIRRQSSVVKKKIKFKSTENIKPIPEN